MTQIVCAYACVRACVLRCVCTCVCVTSSTVLFPLPSPPPHRFDKRSLIQLECLSTKPDSSIMSTLFINALSFQSDTNLAKEHMEPFDYIYKYNPRRFHMVNLHKVSVYTLVA